MPRATTSDQGIQIDLAAWAQELDDERERVEKANEQRAARRGYVVFATDPSRAPDEPTATARRRRRSARSPTGAGYGRTSRPARTRTSWPTRVGSCRRPARSKLRNKVVHRCDAVEAIRLVDLDALPHDVEASRR